MSPRQLLHDLVEELPEDELLPAQRYLEYLKERGEDPLHYALSRAPVDDEPVTDDDLQAIREGLAERARGEVVSDDELDKLLAERA